MAKDSGFPVGTGARYSDLIIWEKWTQAANIWTTLALNVLEGSVSLLLNDDDGDNDEGHRARGPGSCSSLGASWF